MRTLTFFAVVAVLAVVAIASYPRVFYLSYKSSMEEADYSLEQSATDIDKFMAHFTPDATMSWNGAPAIKGQNAIREQFGGLMKAPGFNITWKITRSELASSVDLGYTVGTYELTMNNAAGVPATEKGNYLTTWRRIDRKWKVVDTISNSDAPTPISSPHVMVPPGKVTWLPGPPNLPPGATVAVLSGDPAGPGPFTVRVQFPAGYKVAPHWHPNDEHATVLSGTLAVGMGKVWDDQAMTDLPAGSYVVTAATMTHFALAKTPTTIQVSGMGPFVTNYVNPADDPSRK